VILFYFYNNKNMKASDFSSQMSFMERVQNFLYLYYSKYTRSNYLRTQQEIAKQIFGRNTADLRDVELSFDLLLTNTGMPGLDPSRILPANVKEVGCLQCRPGNTSNLPKVKCAFTAFLRRNLIGVCLIAGYTRLVG
jgi:UDP-glucoronosyl and UDP-glucosyl transferase